MFQNRQRRIMKTRISFLLALVFIVVLAKVIPVLALTEDGTGGGVNAGATYNTFAREMPLAEVFFEKSVFNAAPSDIEITDNTSGALQESTYGMTILGSKLTHNTADNNLKGQYALIYEDGAILPDGTAMDVVITLDLARIMTVSNGDVPMPYSVLIFRSEHPSYSPGLDFTTIMGGGTGASANLGIAVEQIMTITVDSAGDFVVPFYGITQNKNNANSYAVYRLTFPDNNIGYDAAIETVKISDTDSVYLPTNTVNYSTIDNDTFIMRGGAPESYDPSGPNGSGSSDESGYLNGFAAFGTSGFKASISTPTSSSWNSEFSVNQFVSIGDLIHRIWSGSGTGGSINTYKQGASGNKLDGGSFTGDVPTGMPAENTPEQQLMRYVIPDAKEGVTYTMTPKTGYVIDEVVVDGTVITIGDDIVVGQTWDTAPSTDGGGVLTYKGDGVFSYVFANANTQDHSIYVTWKKATADIIVNKVWQDDSKASKVSAKVRLTSDAEDQPVDYREKVPVTSGEVHKWTKMPVYNYDENGDATTAIVYKLSETPNPVSAYYYRAEWEGQDYTGGTADGGFTLVDPGLTSGVRGIDDPFIATVTNTLSPYQPTPEPKYYTPPATGDD